MYFILNLIYMEDLYEYINNHLCTYYASLEDQYGIHMIGQYGLNLISNKPSGGIFELYINSNEQITAEEMSEQIKNILISDILNKQIVSYFLNYHLLKLNCVFNEFVINNNIINMDLFQFKQNKKMYVPIVKIRKSNNPENDIIGGTMQFPPLDLMTYDGLLDIHKRLNDREFVGVLMKNSSNISCVNANKNLVIMQNDDPYFGLAGKDETDTSQCVMDVIAGRIDNNYLPQLSNIYHVTTGNLLSKLFTDIKYLIDDNPSNDNNNLIKITRDTEQQIFSVNNPILSGALFLRDYTKHSSTLNICLNMLHLLASEKYNKVIYDEPITTSEIMRCQLDSYKPPDETAKLFGGFPVREIETLFNNSINKISEYVKILISKHKEELKNKKEDANTEEIGYVTDTEENYEYNSSGGNEKKITYDDISTLETLDYFYVLRYCNYFVTSTGKYCTEADFKVGSYIYNPCFMSTFCSTNINSSWLYKLGQGAIFIIRVPYKDNFVSLKHFENAFYGSENEVLLPSRRYLQIISVTRKNIETTQFKNIISIPCVFANLVESASPSGTGEPFIPSKDKVLPFMDLSEINNVKSDDETYSILKDIYEKNIKTVTTVVSKLKKYITAQNTKTFTDTNIKIKQPIPVSVHAGGYYEMKYEKYKYKYMKMKQKNKTN